MYPVLAARPSIEHGVNTPKSARKSLGHTIFILLTSSCPFAGLSQSWQIIRPVWTPHNPVSCQYSFSSLLQGIVFFALLPSPTRFHMKGAMGPRDLAVTEIPARYQHLYIYTGTTGFGIKKPSRLHTLPWFPEFPLAPSIYLPIAPGSTPSHPSASTRAYSSTFHCPLARSRFLMLHSTYLGINSSNCLVENKGKFRRRVRRAQYPHTEF